MLRGTLLLLLAFVGLGVVFAYPDDYNNYKSTTNQSRTAVFCYINGTRLVTQVRRNVYQSVPFTLENINVDLCTHILYGAAMLDPNTWSIRPVDNDLENRQSTANKISFDDLTELKNRKRDLKVLISVSGNPIAYSNMAKQYRQTFVQQARNFLMKHKFDGINIDWQYPARRGGVPEDKQNFGALMKELKITLRGDAKLLTTYVSPIKAGMTDSYDFFDKDVVDAVDYWIVLATEYYGHAYSAIGANSPIQSREKYSVTKTIEDLRTLMDRNMYKIVLVIPFYGKMYQLEQPITSYDSPFGKNFVNKHAPPESVTLTYREICQKMTSEREWRREWDRISETPYIVKDSVAILYDDAESVAKKTSFALRQGLGGVMAFSIDMDDFDGECSSGTDSSRRTSSDYNNYGTRDHSSRKYPLLQSMYDTVERGPNSAGLHSSPLALVLSIIGAVLLKAYA